MTGSSFSIATTAFVSLAICAIISYGVFYYFKQRLSLIEQSQMEQARILQAIISRGLPQQHSAQQPQQPQATQQLNAEQQATQQCHREITITQNSLIEVSSDEESSSDSESESSDSESESGSGSGSDTESDKWSIGDEIHQSDAYHKEFNEMSERMRALSSEKKQIHIDSIESLENVDDIGIENIETNAAHNAANNEDDTNTKKIISLNSTALVAESDDDEDDDSSSSDSDEKPQQFEVKIGYKSAASSNKDALKAAVHLNYGNMSVTALRQLAKERGLGGDDADLQKLKKKDLVQLLQ
jgi:hypothetical protein